MCFCCNGGGEGVYWLEVIGVVEVIGRGWGRYVLLLYGKNKNFNFVVVFVYSYWNNLG